MYSSGDVNRQGIVRVSMQLLFCKFITFLNVTFLYTPCRDVIR